MAENDGDDERSADEEDDFSIILSSCDKENSWVDICFYIDSLKILITYFLLVYVLTGDSCSSSATAKLTYVSLQMCRRNIDLVVFAAFMSAELTHLI